MKALVLAALLLASPALAAGVFTDSTATPATTDTANVTATLWSDSIGGGAVTNGNALDVEGFATAGVQWAQTGFVYVKLNGQTVASICMDGYQSGVKFHARVWRTGNTTGYTEVYAFMPDGWVSIGNEPIYGLAWTSTQALAVTGVSNEYQGLTLHVAGVKR